MMTDGEDTLQKRLTLRYLSVLGLLAVLLISGYTAVSLYLSENSSDGNLINISGRQRMLTQRIVALGLQKKYER